MAATDASSFMSGFMGQGGVAGATPYGAMIQGATQLGMKALEPVATNSHVTGQYDFDNSGGFTLNIGAGTARSTDTKTQTAIPTAAQAAQVAAAGVGSLLGNPVFVIAVGLGLFLYLKHK
jgi:hypothetical protein